MRTNRFLAMLLCCTSLMVMGQATASAQGTDNGPLFYGSEIEAKPVLAVLPGPISSEYNHLLYRLLSNSSVSLARFKVMDEARIMQALMSDSGVIQRGYEYPTELGKLLGADFVLFAEVLDSPSEQQVYDHMVLTEYRSKAKASIMFVDVHHAKKAVGFEVEGEGSDRHSGAAAKEAAVYDVAGQILGAVRSLTRQQTKVLSKAGRIVVLDQGYTHGLRPNFFFDAVDAHGKGLGLLKILDVEDETAHAIIIQGTTRIASGSFAIENPYGRMPAGVGYAARVLLSPQGQYQGAFHTLDLHGNQSGLWNSLGVELGYVSNQDQVSGLSFFGRFEPQLDVVPERLWLYYSVGAGFNVLGSSAPIAPSGAYAVTAHAMASVGINLHMFDRINLFGDVGYLTPWTVSNWQVNNDGQTHAVTGYMPTPTVGGPFIRVGSTWSY